MSKVIFVLGLILTLVTSCKKDEQTVPTTTTTNSKGTKQLRAILSGNDTVFTLFYKNNKIDSLVNKTNGLFFNFLYEKNSITWFRTVDGEIPENHRKYFTALLDTDGLTYSSSQNSGENSTYLYDNKQLIEIKSTSVKIPGEPATDRKNQYKWENGNIVRLISNRMNEAINDTLYYEYSSKLNKDFWHIGTAWLSELYRIENVLFRNPIGAENKNLVKSIYNSKKQVIQSFDYLFDDAGYVVKYTTIKFEYTNGIQTSKTSEASFVWR
jgi:hypothetical protein